MKRELLVRSCKTLHLAHVMDTFESIPFENCTEKSLRELVFLVRKENILMLGKVGTGKTHLAIVLGVEA